MIIYPKAKINLGLRVTGKRDDGFHNLESCFVEVAQLTDILEIMESNKLSFSLYGKELDCVPGHNICEKAFDLLCSDFDLPGAEIHLYKKIPTGAGLGGGSSDGAATLYLLNTIYGLGLTKEQLMEYAARLGSDCPFFIHLLFSDNKGYTCAMVGGRGDIIWDYRLPVLENYDIKVVDTGVFISTAEAFGGIITKKPEVPLKDVLALPVSEWKGLLVNDFEPHIFDKHPILLQHKENLYQQGAVYASMSGSGSAIYGLFKKGRQL